MSLRTGAGVIKGPGNVPPARPAANAGDLLRAALSLEALPLNLLAFLVGRATVLQTISPFGLAFFAATLALYPRRGLGVGLAVAAGILSAGVTDACLEFVGAALGLVLLHLAFGRGGRQRSPALWAALTFTVTVVAGAGKALLLEPTPYRFLMALFAGLVTFVLTLVYLAAAPSLAIPRRPVHLGTEQILAMALTAATALAGLSGLGYGAIRVSGMASGALILVAAHVAGGGVGAAIGTVAGVVAALCGAGGLSSVGVAALSGLLAGSFRDFGKPGAAAGFFFGTLLLSPLMEEAHFLQAVVLESALAALLFLIIPERVWTPLRGAIRAAAQGATVVEAEAAARENVGKRLSDLSLVFGQLAATLKELSATAPVPPARRAASPPQATVPDPSAGSATAPAGTSAILPPAQAPPADPAAANLVQAACRVCQACRLFKACWKGDLERTRGAMTSLFEVTTERDQLETRDVPANIRRRCVHLGELVTTMNFLHEIAALNRHWRKKLDDSRNVVSQQLDGLSQILRQLGQGLTTGASGDARAVEELVRRLDQAGFPVREVSASRVPDGQAEFLVRADLCPSGDACRDVVLPAAAALLGSELHIAAVSCGHTTGQDECCFRLAVPRQLGFKMGVTQARKSSSGISGDSYMVQELPGNRLAAILSDGTGAGPRAAEESRTTIRMLEELLRLGFDTEMAVRTINATLMLRSTSERFATLDLLTVDLCDGQARFVKVGAPPSYVRRGREVSVISSPNLPLGVVPEVATEGRVLTLRPGDLVVLATDGLIASQSERRPGTPVAPGQAPEDGWIVSYLRDMGEASPQEVTDALVEAALSTGAGRLPLAVGAGTAGTGFRMTGFSGYRVLRDDITVMALRFGPPDGP